MQSSNITLEDLKKLYDNGEITVEQIAEKLNVSTATLYRSIRPFFERGCLRRRCRGRHRGRNRFNIIN